MINRKPLPEEDYLNERFVVNSGRLLWRAKKSTSKEDKRWNTRYAGKVAGTVSSSGYSIVKLDGVRYLEHRLCFKLYHGYCPDVIDHDDGNKLNNAEENLIDSTYLKNNNNRHFTGLEGVYERSGIFTWVVNYGKETFSQSGFKTKEEAAVSRSIAKQRIVLGGYCKQEKKRIDNSTGLSCVFVAKRERTFFFKFGFDKNTYYKYGFSDPIVCAIALEKCRWKVMRDKYKPSNIKIYEKYEEEINDT